MRTYGRTIEIILKRLEYLERVVGTELPLDRTTELKLASEVPFQITKDVSAEIRNDYDDIEEAINKLSIIDKDMPRMKHELLQLKRKIPLNYQITTQDRENILAEINKILGVNRSDRP